MKILKIGDAENVTLGLQEEIRRSEESRYDHRLHGVLLVAQGLNCCRQGRSRLLRQAAWGRTTHGRLLGGTLRRRWVGRTAGGGAQRAAIEVEA